MTGLRVISSIVLALACAAAFAAAPTIDSPLPVLDIAERGELTQAGAEFKFVPWRSDAARGDVNVVQYIGATMSDSEIFKPFTDLLAKNFDGAVHVTSVINLDAAMWGTTGMVISELEKNKRMFPEATMVVDDKGLGVATWELGEKGVGLLILDENGIVKFFTRQAMTEAELNAGLELVRTAMAH